MPSKENSYKALGNIGEAKVIAKFIELGFPTYLQFGDNEKADIIVIFNGFPLKLQIKSTNDGNTSKVAFNLMSKACLTHFRHIYSEKEVDGFALYDFTNDKVFLLENTGDLKSVVFRYKDTRNHQMLKVKYAKDYFLCVETLHALAKSSLKKTFRRYAKDKVRTTM